jgi:hypothetical protein
MHERGALRRGAIGRNERAGNRLRDPKGAGTGLAYFPGGSTARTTTMSAKTRYYSIATVISVFVFGSIGGSAAKWLAAVKAQLAHSAVAAVATAEPVTLPVVGLGL